MLSDNYKERAPFHRILPLRSILLSCSIFHYILHKFSEFAFPTSLPQPHFCTLEAQGETCQNKFRKVLSLKGYPLCDFGADIPPFSVTAAVVIQWHWAESSPTEHIALHRNRYIPMLSDGDDSSETERSSFGPENILAKNSLRVSFSLLSFYAFNFFL